MRCWYWGWQWWWWFCKNILTIVSPARLLSLSHDDQNSEANKAEGIWNESWSHQFHRGKKKTCICQHLKQMIQIYNHSNRQAPNIISNIIFLLKRIPNLWSYGEIYLWSEKKKNKWGNIWFLHHLNLEIFWGKKGHLTKAKDTRLIVLQQWGCKGWSNIWVRLLKYKRTIETCNGKIPKEWVHMDRMSKQWKLKVAMWQIKTTPSTSYDLGRSLPLGSIRFGPALISMPANRALWAAFQLQKGKTIHISSI